MDSRENRTNKTNNTISTTTSIYNNHPSNSGTAAEKLRE